MEGVEKMCIFFLPKTGRISKTIRDKAQVATYD